MAMRDAREFRQREKSGTLSHQHDLTWYLTEGISYFERSTFGAQLDSIIFMAFGSAPCSACQGLGILDEPWTMTHRRLTDGARVKLDEPIELSTGKDCDKCGGVGSYPLRLISDDIDDWEHDGEGAITCCPKNHKSNSTTREAPPDAILTRYALVSRRLSQMPRILSLALQAAYGDEGEANSSSKRGRAWAATPLTPAGGRLLERHRRAEDGNDNQFRAVLAMTELAKLDESHSIPERKKLLAEASEQAIRLVRMAEESWETLEGRKHA